VSTGFARVDERLRERVGQVRAAAQAPSPDAEHDPLAGYYVSEAEVDRLLAAVVPELPEAGRARLAGLAEAFALTAFDLDVVLTCLGPELDSRYGRLYAYLHDDLTRRVPSVDLVLTLWCPDGASRLAGRARLAPGAPLRRHGLVRLDESGDPQAASMLECPLRLDPRLARHLLEDDDPDERLADVLVPGVLVPAGQLPEARRPGSSAAGWEPWEPTGLAAALAAIVERTGTDVVVHLRGAAGSGRLAVAAAFCQSAAVPLLVARCGALAAESDPRCAELVGLVGREARLRGAATYWRDVDLLAGERLGAFVDALADCPGPVLLGGAGDWPGPEPPARPFVRLELARPDAPARREIWASLVAPASAADRAGRERGLAFDEADPPDPEALAGAFRFTAGQIRDAVAAATTLAVTRDPAAPRLRQADLAKAARSTSGRGLVGIARHVVTPYGWDDLVLPPGPARRLRELADQLRHRGLVHDAWGFGRAVAPAGGLTVLFAGPPGTGKTMAASVLANTLGVDLHAVDLATTVNKYIGETEKNLARAFEAAADSNAILFFDEADALFGRRTQVRDSHDRYANIETSYLLQRIETHPGVVILATNLRKNMDEAFVRRFGATVEFPAPDEAERLRIWQRIWPAAAPLGPDVDLATLAREVDLPGGHLRNIVLSGAFLAAADGGTITMAHLLQAARAEYDKLGKIVANGALTAAPPAPADRGRDPRGC